MSENFISLATLFKGEEKTLHKCLQEAVDWVPAKDVAEKLIQPVLPRLEKNVGQEMDALYVAYLVEYSASLIRPA